MDYYDAVAVLAGRSRDAARRGRRAASVATATATSDSSGGRVRVDFGGASVTGDGMQSVEVPTTVDVRAGDVVRVELVGADGAGKSPTVTGVVGGGDRTRMAVDEAASDASAARSTAGEAKSAADAAGATAAEAKEGADAAVAETKDLVTLRIDSSRGTVFKNSEVSTVLTVRCYKRGAEITTREALRDAMGDQTARVRWWVLREGDAGWVSLADSDPMLSADGFALTLSPADVDVKCTFKAEVVTD